MKRSKTFAISVSSVLFLGMMTLSTGLALAKGGSGGGGEVRLIAKMVTGAASGKADFRQRGDRRRLNVEAEDLPNTTPTQQPVFVNSMLVGTMMLEPCPVATQILCGELELNTQDGDTVHTILENQSVMIGSPALLSGIFASRR